MDYKDRDPPLRIVSYEDAAKWGVDLKPLLPHTALFEIP